ncbi:MAG: c-type cytochrome [Alphaproteobacteria bacterium]|nr:c-type cytochrome [Alphaproteobacteria bacterium]MCB9686054.1 c-type cytochrome [Alphaproteobacteria bacterium]
MVLALVVASAVWLPAVRDARAGDSAPAADLARGEEVYARCAACHSLTENRTGPRHCGLFGRAAASQPGFQYSKAMQRSGLVWDAATLDRFLRAPLDVVPGTKMTYAGISDPSDRAALVAYLEVASRSEACTAAAQESP